ncbi:hypothetical protein ABTX81_30810 [Kitasatospora sp. NPDC097605]|uniref:hypothetical protein n=1 Tax=Kitasatospora sp. NPDC097605 TaxID=3157226 RepID=UPI003320ECC3
MSVESAAIGAAGRTLAALVKPTRPAWHTPIGSKLERRAAYLRHAQACAQLVLASGWQLESGRHGLRAALYVARPVLTEYLAAASATLQSLTEVRLVATPEVRTRAETLADTANAAHNGDAELQAYRDASAAYLALVQAELGYAVRWWQAHRRLGAWWRARPDRQGARRLQREAAAAAS